MLTRRALSMRLIAAGALLLVALTGSGSGQQPAAAPVELQVVKYGELCKAVRAQKGKVVVVDLWADWCIPCKMAFPHLVELHKRYAKDGLVCMSISLDEAKDKQKPLAFLQKQNALFPNFLLDEEVSLWQEKFDINGPPAIFVFNRDNRRARKFDGNDPRIVYTHEDVEKLVKELLQQGR
ncbi:MAG: redoxin domain-containing protein [Planctomycetia bacterium]|nr:redoxin domain-containing protein [Planctomycetia bacterium]